MIRRFRQQLCPPGYPLEKDITVLLAGLVMAFLTTLGFLTRYEHALWEFNLYLETVPLSHIRFPSFFDLLGRAMNGYLILAVVMPILALLHYRAYHQGTKSIYLMRRVPDRTLIHRQCWSFPLLGIAVTVLCWALNLFVYLSVYHFATPAALLQTVCP